MRTTQRPPVRVPTIAPAAQHVLQVPMNRARTREYRFDDVRLTFWGCFRQVRARLKRARDRERVFDVPTVPLSKKPFGISIRKQLSCVSFTSELPCDLFSALGTWPRVAQRARHARHLKKIRT